MTIKNVALISLGCDKNRVDAENMLYYLCGKDLVVTNDYSKADAIIVNTCAFIESARKEAIETILEMAEYKKSNCKRLIVTGCLSEKYRPQLIAELPEVDDFLGINEYEKIYAAIIGDKNAVCPVSEHKRVLTTPAHYAYLKISDGCNNHCTFCTIPSIRGAYKSRTIESLTVELSDLVSRGVQEVILVAQDVTNYGKDLYGKPSLVELLRELEKTDIEYIRLMYCYPELVSDELIDYVAKSKKVLHYLDIPLQHVDDSVLKRMGRRSTYSSICELFDKLKSKIPDISVRTTMMVGFPGETDEQFEKLYDFVAKYKPDHLGVFAYSREEGTPSYKMDGQLTKKIKKQRVDKLGKLNLLNTEERNRSLVGKKVKVIYEDIDYDREMFIGRMLSDAPDIDSRVYFTGRFADVGNTYDVKITGFDKYDLTGELSE